MIASILAPRQEREISTGEQQGGGIPINEEGEKHQLHQNPSVKTVVFRFCCFSLKN